MNEQRTLAKIPCGGGSNRKWDFKYGHGLEGSKNASFTFVRDKEIFYTFLPMEGYLNVTMKVILLLNHSSLYYYPIKYSSKT